MQARIRIFQKGGGVRFCEIWLRCIGICCCIFIVLLKEKLAKNATIDPVHFFVRHTTNRQSFRKVTCPLNSFQKNFFLVYFLALLGDWLQGPYVYKLYAFYGYKVSTME